MRIKKFRIFLGFGSSAASGDACASRTQERTVVAGYPSIGN